MGNVIGLLNGYKSYLGISLLIVAELLGPGAPAPDVLSAEVASYFVVAGQWLGGVGLAHKLAKLA